MVSTHYKGLWLLRSLRFSLITGLALSTWLLTAGTTPIYQQSISPQPLGAVLSFLGALSWLSITHGPRDSGSLGQALQGPLGSRAAAGCWFPSPHRLVYQDLWYLAGSTQLNKIWQLVISVDPDGPTGMTTKRGYVFMVYKLEDTTYDEEFLAWGNF